MPPLFFQHAGHSRTLVGVLRQPRKGYTPAAPRNHTLPALWGAKQQPCLGTLAQTARAGQSVASSAGAHMAHSASAPGTAPAIPSGTGSAQGTTSAPGAASASGTATDGAQAGNSSSRPRSAAGVTIADLCLEEWTYALLIADPSTPADELSAALRCGFAS